MARTKDKVDQHPSKSQEYVDVSSSEAESESEPELDQPPEDILNRSNSKTITQQTSGTDDETSSADESDSDEPTTNSASQQTVGTKRVSESSVAAQEPLTKKSKANHKASQRAQTSAYTPPAGYDIVKLDPSTFNSQTGNMFSNSSRKQIWHITAPASVSIASIKELNIHAALRGEPVLQSGGTSYSMFAAASEGEILLLPGGAQNTYSEPEVKISRNLYLREIPQNKDIANGTSRRESLERTNEHEHDQSHSTQFFATGGGIKKPQRKQPSGLLMRYQPYGTVRDSDRPQQLPAPDTDDSATEKTVSVPLAVGYEDTDSQSNKRRATKTSKRTTSDKLSQKDAISGDGEMDIDTKLINGTTHGQGPVDNMSKTNHEPEKRRKK